MRKVISFVLILGCLMSLVGCGDTSSDVQILSDKVASEDYLSMVKPIANDLYNTSNHRIKFSAVGSAADNARTEYVYEKFNEIGLKNVNKVPIMLNSWDYTEVSMVSNCNCGDNSDVTMRIIGAYPRSFNYENTEYMLHRVADKLDITRENIENFAILVPSVTTVSELEEYVNAVAAYNPTLILCSTIHTNISNVYEVNTDLFTDIDCPIFVLPNSSYGKLVRYFNNTEDNSLKITLNGRSNISEELVESNFVVGEIEGKDKNKVVYVTAHQDAIHSGYMGSCVSVAELITMADKLIKEGFVPDYTIRFMVTTGQEWGKVGQGQNVGIQTYLDGLSEKEIDSIQSVLVLDGGYPFIDTVFLETKVSNTKILDKVKSYNSDYFAKNDSRFINEIVVIDDDIKYVTEAIAWNNKGIDTVLSSEPNNSRFIYNNTSLDNHNLEIDETLLKHQIDYYTGLLKIMTNN